MKCPLIIILGLKNNMILTETLWRKAKTWNKEKGRFEGYPPGAHENASSQLNWTFPGYEEYYSKNMFK
jgi:hypothetical protein